MQTVNLIQIINAIIVAFGLPSLLLVAVNFGKKLEILNRLESNQNNLESQFFKLDEKVSEIDKTINLEIRPTLKEHSVKFTEIETKLDFLLKLFLRDSKNKKSLK